MADRGSRSCCGCDSRQYVFDPSFYSARPIGLLWQRLTRTVTDRIIVRTEAYQSGQLVSSNDDTPEDVPRSPVITVDTSIDDVLAWGQWDHEFPPQLMAGQETQSDDPIVTSGTVASGTYTQTVRRSTPYSFVLRVEMRRRLTLEFDLRDYLLFGVDRDDSPVIVTAHLRLNPAGYIPAEYQAAADLDNDLAGNVHGITLAELPPATAAGFDAAVAAAENNADVTAPDGAALPIDVTDWLPDDRVASDRFAYLFLDTPELGSGGSVSGVRLAIARTAFDARVPAVDVSNQLINSAAGVLRRREWDRSITLARTERFGQVTLTISDAAPDVDVTYVDTPSSIRATLTVSPGASTVQSFGADGSGQFVTERTWSARVTQLEAQSLIRHYRLSNLDRTVYAMAPAIARVVTFDTTQLHGNATWPQSVLKGVAIDTPFAPPHTVESLNDRIDDLPSITAIARGAGETNVAALLPNNLAATESLTIATVLADPPYPPAPSPDYSLAVWQSTFRSSLDGGIFPLPAGLVESAGATADLRLSLDPIYTNQFSGVARDQDWRSLWTKISDHHYRLNRTLPSRMFSVTVPLHVRAVAQDVGKAITMHLSPNQDGSTPWVSAVAECIEDAAGEPHVRITSAGQSTEGALTMSMQVHDQLVTIEAAGIHRAIAYVRTVDQPDRLYLHLVVSGPSPSLAFLDGTAVSALGNPEDDYRPTCPTGVCPVTFPFTSTYWSPTITTYPDGFGGTLPANVSGSFACRSTTRFPGQLYSLFLAEFFQTYPLRSSVFFLSNDNAEFTHPLHGIVSLAVSAELRPTTDAQVADVMLSVAVEVGYVDLVFDTSFAFPPNPTRSTPVFRVGRIQFPLRFLPGFEKSSAYSLYLDASAAGVTFTPTNGVLNFASSDPNDTTLDLSELKLALDYAPPPNA